MIDLTITATRISLDLVREKILSNNRRHMKNLKSALMKMRKHNLQNLRATKASIRISILWEPILT